MTDKSNVLGEMYVDPDPVEDATGIRAASALTRQEVEAIIHDFERHAEDYHHQTSVRTQGALKKLEGWLQGRPTEVARQRAEFLESYRYVIQRDHARNEVERLKREVASMRARLTPEADDDPKPEPTVGVILGQLIGSLLAEQDERVWTAIRAHMDWLDWNEE